MYDDARSCITHLPLLGFSSEFPPCVRFKRFCYLQVTNWAPLCVKDQIYDTSVKSQGYIVVSGDSVHLDS